MPITLRFHCHKRPSIVNKLVSQSDNASVFGTGIAYKFPILQTQLFIRIQIRCSVFKWGRLKATSSKTDRNFLYP